MTRTATWTGRAAIRAAALGAAAVLGVVLVGTASRDDPDERGPLPASAPGSAWIADLRVVTKDGHGSHPTWYHDSQVLERDGLITVVYNGDSKVFAAQLRAADLEIVAKERLDRTDLGGRTDTTGTDTNRHDVPAVGADRAGRLHVLYGGGSLAARGPRVDGPLHRATQRPNDVTAFGPERALDIGGGAAFDFEAVRTRDGVVHFFGQRGQGRTGSLIQLRLLPDGRWDRPRELVRGGRRREACVRDGVAQGCNVFAIARAAVDRRGRLHLTWGWSERGLSNRCGSDRGYCDVDLFHAMSADGGERWTDARGRASRRMSRAPIRYDDPALRVGRGAIGLFKALAVAPDGTPLIVHTRGPYEARSLHALRLAGGRWRSSLVARAGEGARNFHGAPVLRADRRGFSLWIATGNQIIRFVSRDGRRWAREKVYEGPAWSLTGTPSADGEHQLLLWRGRREGGASEVLLGRAPAG